MNRRGLISKIILIVFLILIVVVATAGIYFYNFHVFKEVRVCIGEGRDTSISCEVEEDCFDVFNISLDKLEGSPEFVFEEVSSVLERAVYCDGTCFVREVRGVDFESGELEELESCGNSEEEVVLEVRGKEGLEILDWMKSQDLGL